MLKKCEKLSAMHSSENQCIEIFSGTRIFITISEQVDSIYFFWEFVTECWKYQTASCKMWKSFANSVPIKSAGNEMEMISINSIFFY